MVTTGEPKVKLYRDAEGQLKGDGLCCYLKVGQLCLCMHYSSFPLQ